MIKMNKPLKLHLLYGKLLVINADIKGTLETDNSQLIYQKNSVSTII